MSEDRYLEDYEIGEERGTTGRTITEADIVLHAGQTGDFYPHHMDAEWCASQPFKQRIAHGTLVFSVAIGMAANVINPRSMSYGYDRLRFIKPVFIGDTIRVRTTIKEKRAHKRPGYGILVEKVDVVKQGDELVLTCEHIHLVEMRAPLGASA
jgi:acyl dehydratase